MFFVWTIHPSSLLLLKPRRPPCPSARSQAGWDLKYPESVLDYIPGGLHREPSRRRPDRFRFNRLLWNTKERQSAQSSELLTSSLRVNRDSLGRKEGNLGWLWRWSHCFGHQPKLMSRGDNLQDKTLTFSSSPSSVTMMTHLILKIWHRWFKAMYTTRNNKSLWFYGWSANTSPILGFVLKMTFKNVRYIDHGWSALITDWLWYIYPVLCSSY